MSHKDALVSLAFEARKLVLDLNAALAECFRPLGLSCVQAEALMVLAEIQPATLKQLSEKLVAESGHPSRLISRLVENGLVIREASPSDGRSRLLSLSSSGLKLARQADKAREPLIESFKDQDALSIATLAKTLASIRAGLL